MIILNHTYKAADALRLPFKAAPVNTVLYALLSVIQAIMPTAAMAAATANFVDTALMILQGSRSHDDIYLPLALLLTVLCVFQTVGAVIELIRSRISTRLQS